MDQLVSCILDEPLYEYQDKYKHFQIPGFVSLGDSLMSDFGWMSLAGYKAIYKAEKQKGWHSF